MKIGLVGNFQQSPSGEIADEVHIARSMEELGHEVYKIPRDEWREYVIENSPKDKYKVPEDIQMDIVIFAKWHHFYDGSFIQFAREKYKCPVFYWVWDSVDLGIEWHKKMAQQADLYLSCELGRVSEFHKNDIRFYYFQFDSVDGSVPYVFTQTRLDVVYLGSCDNQNGRVDLLKAINKEIPVIVYGPDYEEWKRQGFEARPAVFGIEANKIIAQAKVVLGTSCDPHLYGYWSNRVGRVLYTRGKLLQQYTPGMENFLHDWVEYYSTPEEAIEKIKILLSFTYKEIKGFDYNQWSSFNKVKDLLIMIERYLKEDCGREWKLP